MSIITSQGQVSVRQYADQVQRCVDQLAAKVASLPTVAQRTSATTAIASGGGAIAALMDTFGIEDPA